MTIVAAAGASHAHYIFLRLPHEVAELFSEWLEAHFPDRAAHVGHGPPGKPGQQLALVGENGSGKTTSVAK